MINSLKSSLLQGKKGKKLSELKYGNYVKKNRARKGRINIPTMLLKLLRLQMTLLKEFSFVLLQEILKYLRVSFPTRTSLLFETLSAG